MARAASSREMQNGSRGLGGEHLFCEGFFADEVVIEGSFWFIRVVEDLFRAGGRSSHEGRTALEVALLSLYRRICIRQLLLDVWSSGIFRPVV
jgi:hypothetical protein